MTNEELLSKEDVKSIVGYEGLYAISKSGRVWSLSRPYVNNKGVTTKIKPLKEINAFFDGKKNYKLVGLSKDGKRTKYLLHRLVAETFIKNKNNNLEVNHIDADKTNNNVDNLEWCTRVENLEHARNNGLVKNDRGKKIVQMDKDGNFIAEHKSIRSAGRSLNKGMGNIANCCRGAIKSAYGYKWCYKNEKE